MNKKSYVSVLTIITTYLTVRIVHIFTGFSYNLSEGILNIKLLEDLGLWIIVYVFIRNIFNRVLLKSKKYSKYA